MQNALLMLMAGTTCIATTTSSVLVAYMVLSGPNQAPPAQNTTNYFSSSGGGGDYVSQLNANSTLSSCWAGSTSLIKSQFGSVAINPLTPVHPRPNDYFCNEDKRSVGPDGIVRSDGRPVGCIDTQRCGWIDFDPRHPSFLSMNEFYDQTEHQFGLGRSSAPVDIGASEIPSVDAAAIELARTRTERNLTGPLYDASEVLLHTGAITSDIFSVSYGIAKVGGGYVLTEAGGFDFLDLDRTQDFWSASNLLPETSRLDADIKGRQASRNASYEAAQKRLNDAEWYDRVRTSASKVTEQQERALGNHRTIDHFRWMQQPDGTFELPAENRSFDGVS